MKTWSVTFAAGLLAALTACGGPPDRIDPKGSYPDAGTGNVEVPQTGDLAVRTHLAPFQQPIDKDRFGYKHASYSVYDSQGQRVGGVDNMVTDGVEKPTRVRLPAGRYLVRIDDGDEPTVFWTTVSPGDLTMVDVEALRGLPGTPRPDAPIEPVIPPVE